VQTASNSMKWCSRPQRVSPPNRAHGIAVGRGTWTATQQVAEVTAARSDCIAGFGLLTASRVRDIRPASSWRPASVGNGHGAKLPKNPANIAVPGQNGM
jgi:hypothetical protein